MAEVVLKGPRSGAAISNITNSKLDALVVIPAQYSRRVEAKDNPQLGLVVDNSDQFTSSSVEGEMQSLVDALNAPVIQPRVITSIALEFVELYPYVSYMKFLLAGCIALAIAAGVTGLVLFLTNPSAAPPNQAPVLAVSPVVTAHGAGAGATLRF